MAGYKETPRQKMIAMMYLVLTALLALNVSVEILQAFIIVNESMESTNETFAKKIDATYSKFELQYNLNKSKVGPYWEGAKKAAQLSDAMKKYINDAKYTVISRSDGISYEQASKIPLRLVETKDKYDQPTNYFIGNSQDGSAGKARELKDKINEYKQGMLKLIDPQSRNVIKMGLDTDGPFYDAGGAKQNWEMHNFYTTILAADVTILNKLIAEVQSVELDVISHLYSSVSAEDFKFDKVGAKVVAKSQYVFLGENYEAEIFVAAYDTKQNPQVLISGRSISGAEGVALYKVPATSEGPKTYEGVIRIAAPNGDMMTYPFKSDYIVAPPTLTISPTKMNVFYIGVDNPVSISAGGIADANLIPRITAGSTISRSGKGWIVKSNQPGKAVISVDARLEQRVKSMGNMEFRVKRVPDPKPYIANSEGGNVAKNLLIAAGAIIPRMPQDFEFDLNPIITSFTFVSMRGSDIVQIEGKGNRLSEEMKKIIGNAKRGGRIWLEDIYAKMPDGSRKLGTISIIVQ
jgi:gliding motility-associated protein GldM